jgi:osmotically-inducible protein OsmY
MRRIENMPASEREHQGQDWERPNSERDREHQGRDRGQSNYDRDREHQGRDRGQSDYDRERQDYGRDQSYGWGQHDYNREQQGYGWERQGRDMGRSDFERNRQDYGREQQGSSWRQQDYPWGQQGQEGYFGGPHTGRGPKGYQRSDDRIREDICEHLTQHPSIDASEIEIEVKNGEVTLKGTVDNRQAKRMAEDAADSCSGVKEVNNQLRVAQSQQSTNQSQTAQQGQKGRTTV